ncbi:hypothetical protein C8D81_1076 [Enemella evansiae]|nr:hypothetical protein C8D81_1076 [Enemella evansiae]
MARTLYAGCVPEDPQTVPDDRPIAEQDRPTVLREREPAPAPARAHAGPPQDTRQPPLPAQRAAGPLVPQPPGPPPAKQPSKIFSDLNLNGTVPARIRPNIGAWGPTDLPTTKQKKRWRWIIPLLFVIAIIVVTIAGYIFWTMYR